MTDLPQLGTFGTTPTYGNWFDKTIGLGIRWFTATKDSYGKWEDAKVNHAFVYVGNVAGLDGPQIVEAAPGGANFSRWDEYGSNAIWANEFGSLQADGSLAPVTLTDEQRASIASFAKDCAIKKVGYNYLDFLAIAFAQQRFDRRVSYANPPWWAKRLGNTHRLICSQLVDYCYEQANVHLYQDNRLPGLVTPADLYALQTHPQ